MREAHFYRALRRERFGSFGRTARLDHIVHHLGLALGGRPAASFARRMMLSVSNDTLLRVVCRRASIPSEPLAVIGIDDWAWRRTIATERSSVIYNGVGP